MAIFRPGQPHTVWHQYTNSTGQTIPAGGVVMGHGNVLETPSDSPTGSWGINGPVDVQTGRSGRMTYFGPVVAKYRSSGWTGLSEYPYSIQWGPESGFTVLRPYSSSGFINTETLVENSGSDNTATFIRTGALPYFGAATLVQQLVSSTHGSSASTVSFTDAWKVGGVNASSVTNTLTPLLNGVYMLSWGATVENSTKVSSYTVNSNLRANAFTIADTPRDMAVSNTDESSAFSSMLIVNLTANRAVDFVLSATGSGDVLVKSAYLAAQLIYPTDSAGPSEIPTSV